MLLEPRNRTQCLSIFIVRTPLGHALSAAWNECVPGEGKDDVEAGENKIGVMKI